jgi:hypothetical protein
MTTISNTTDHAAEQVKEAASHARTTFLDLSTQVMKLINGAREAEGRGVEAVLDRLGLQRRTSALGPVLWFAVGAAVAGTSVVLMTPTSGKKLRRRIARFLGGEVEAVTTEAKETKEHTEDGMKKMPNGANHPGRVS